MSTVQEQLMLKRVPLDKWSVRELLSLSSSVLRSGNQNWVSVSRAVRVFGEPNRPEDWFSQKNCAVQYSTMLEKADTPKRKKRINNSNEKEIAPVETVGETIVRQFTLDRMEELKQIMEDARSEYLKLQQEVEILQSGNATEEQVAAWTQEEENRKKQKEVDAQNHSVWLQEREKRRIQLERAWKPVHTASRRKQPLNATTDISSQSDADTSVDSTITALFNTDVLGEDSSETKALPSTPTSPFLTSLLKNPSPTKLTPSSSILHSAITSQRGSTPTITSLLSSSPSVPQPHLKSYSQQPDETVPTLSMLLKLPPGAVDTDNTNLGPATSSAQYSNIPGESIHLPPHQQYHLSKSLPNENELVNAICDDMEPIEIGLEEIIADLEQGGGSDVGKELAEDVVTQLVKQSNVDTFHKIFDDFYAMNVKKQDSVDTKPPDYVDLNTSYEHTIPEKSLEVSIEESLPDIKITESEVKQLHNEKVIDLFSDDLLVVQEILEHEDVVLTQGVNNPAVVEPPQPAVEPVQETVSEASTPTAVIAAELSADITSAGLLATKDSVETSTVEKSTVDSEAIKVEPEPKTIKPQDVSKDSKKNIPLIKTTETKVVEVKSCEVLVPKASGLKLVAYSDCDDDNMDDEESSLKADEPVKTAVVEDDVAKVNTEDTATDVEVKSELKSPPAVKEAVRVVDEVKPEPAATEKVSESAEDSRDKSVVSGCEDSSEATELSSEYSNQEKPVVTEIEAPKAESSGVELLTNAKRLMRRANTPAFDSLPNSPASVTTDEEKDYRAWKKSIMLVWNSVAAHKYASVFFKPITDEHAPNYSNTCYGPMDLTTIKRNIETGVIRTTGEFQRDVLRMFTNAVMYNKLDHDIHKIALEIRLDSQQQMQEYIKTQQLILTPGDRSTMRRETRMTDSNMSMNNQISMMKRKRDSDVIKSVKKRKVLSGIP